MYVCVCVFVYMDRYSFTVETVQMCGDVLFTTSAPE